DFWPGNLGSGSQASEGGLPRAPRAGLPEEWSSRLVSAASVARERGTLPAGLEVFVKAAKEPAVPWRQLLSEFLTRVRSGYTWHPFDRRFAHAGVYLPDFGSPGVEEIVLALDTSGSISDDELSQFLAEVKAVVDCDPLRLHVVLCDAAVWSWDTVEQGEPAPHVRVRGRGGTDFRPVFDEVQRRGVFPSALVYLTDGHGAYPELPPPYPVLWVLVDDCAPPFGARVRMYRV
ncbi:MAG: hypothetical protein H5T97_11805, partial [Firmicutes bacterium]|nr:hypothetical protein [Bacillota bacterium]